MLTLETPTMIGLERFTHHDLGYYEYRGHAYSQKMEMLDAALANQDYEPQVNFNFGDAVFGSIDWQIEPPFELSELYRLRAQQIRDEYDYVVLMYTGGSDSREVAYTFINNNIHLDEIVHIYPKTLMTRQNIVRDENHPSAFLFESSLTTMPSLAEIHQLIPRTKITLLDHSDDILNLYKNDNYWTDCNHGSQFGVLHTIKTNHGTQYMRERSQGRGRVAVIYGVDKPKIQMIDDHLYCHFIDTGRTGVNIQRNAMAAPFDAKMFFTAVDAPLIHIKQCHVIRRALETVPGMYEKFLVLARMPGGGQLSAGNVIKNYIYYNWDNQLFQGIKFGYAFSWDEERDFFYQLRPGMEAVLDSRKQMMQNRYGKFKFDPKHTWIMTCTSRRYLVGKIQPPSRLRVPNNLKLTG